MLGAQMAGRKRKFTAIRSDDGKSRDHERKNRLAYEATLERRGRELKIDGIDAENSPDRLAGFTLGRLLLRWRADKTDPSGISQRQYNTGHRLCWVIHRHASLHGYRLTVKAQSFISIGGEDCAAPPTDSDITEIRENFTACYDAIMKVCRLHNLGARDLVYGVCIQNWPINMVVGRVGLLRETLNEVGKALAELDKRRQITD